MSKDEILEQLMIGVRRAIAKWLNGYDEEWRRLCIGELVDGRTADLLVSRERSFLIEQALVLADDLRQALTQEIDNIESGQWVRRWLRESAARNKEGMS